MDDFSGPFSIGVIGTIIVILVIVLYSNHKDCVEVQIDKLSNTKFIQYENKIYLLTPYKNTKE